MSRAAKTYSNPGKALLKMTARPGATAVAVSCRLCADKIEDIDHKEVRLLNEFISKQGQIIPRRISGICARHQRTLIEAIKQGRNIALMPFTSDSIAVHALATFGSQKKARHWMNRPNPLFQGKTPSQIMRTDPVAVEAELVRIDHGVYM